MLMSLRLVNPETLGHERIMRSRRLVRGGLAPWPIAAGTLS